MNYSELKNKQQKEVDNFPSMFAFNNQQFAEGMGELGLLPTDTCKILSIGGGGYIRKTDNKALDELFARHELERKEARKEYQYLYDMFLYELGNHEYCITYCLRDVLDALDLTIGDVNNSEDLKKALYEAEKDYLKFYE